MLIKIHQFEFDRFYKLQNLLKVEFISMHVRGGHIFVYGGVLSVTECIFLFTGGRAYKLGVGGGGAYNRKFTVFVFRHKFLQNEI